MESFVLVHSPVLGPASWSPVAAELVRRGHRVTVPALTGFTDGGPSYVDRLLDRARANLGRLPDSRIVLVVHSGAGVFAPYLAEVAAADTVLFADASLPPSSQDVSPQDVSSQDVSPQVMDAQFLPFLRGIAVDGIVPPWPQWWPAGELAPLYPDEATRTRVNAEAGPLPLAFFEERLPPIPASWRARQTGYLRFSEGYGETARQAGTLGWPVRELPGGHLHILVDPAGVAAALTDLARAVTARTRTS